jgi:tryptophan synthase alpha chain
MSGADRIELVGRNSQGFVYYVSVTGVTGARSSFDDSLRAQVARVRRATALPVGVGFGISTPQQAAWIAGFADAAVVGSALVERIERTKGSNKKAKQAGAFVAQLKQALRQVARSL